MTTRRQFITLLGGAAAAWPLAARAQQLSKVPRIGFLQRVRNENVIAFIQALREAGYVDGQNAVIETRIFETTLDQVPDLAKELVDLKCDVILAASQYAFVAAMKATTTIPIVGIDLENDPVANGWVKSLARPGGNFTGLFLDLPELGGKQIELLKEVVPRLSKPGALWDSAIGEAQFRATQTAAQAAGVTLHSLSIRGPDDFKDAFERAAREQIDGVVILSSPLILERRLQIIEWAIKERLPTISLVTLFPSSGALMAYGPSLPEMYKRAAIYIDRILKGAKAADLPIERPTRFTLVLNVKTARAIGLEIPPIMLARADEVIE
jgi:putative tryptophan/tyrosine transport system substrate-binding protein